MVQSRAIRDRMDEIHSAIERIAQVPDRVSQKSASGSAADGNRASRDRRPGLVARSGCRESRGSKDAPIKALIDELVALEALGLGLWYAESESTTSFVMLVANPEGSGRKCVCCGTPTPTLSMCACWDHWMILPENLGSDLLRAYGWDAKYHRALLDAVRIWRHAGVWRVSSNAR
jgi:hypothetical protein